MHVPSSASDDSTSLSSPLEIAIVSTPVSSSVTVVAPLPLEGAVDGATELRQFNAAAALLSSSEHRDVLARFRVTQPPPSCALRFCAFGYLLFGMAFFLGAMAVNSRAGEVLNGREVVVVVQPVQEE